MQYASFYSKEEKKMEHNFDRDILREAISICEDSDLYSHIDRQERREAVSYIYNLLSMRNRTIVVTETDHSI